jgi:hypothetical protein
LPAPGGGKFFYRFRQDEGCAELTLKPGLVPKEFYDATEALSSGKAKSEEYCLFLRRVVEAALLPLPPSEIFDVARRETCEPPDSPPETAGDISRGFSLTLGDFGIFRAELGDAIAYHGGDSLCGVCLSWALARQWLSALGGADAEIPVPRREIFLETAAQGAGILDAFEFLFRTSGDGRTGELKSSVKAPEVLPGAGSFAFAISMGGGGRKIFALRENMVPRDYLRLCQRRIESPHTFADGETLKALREDFARSMLNEPEPFEVYEAGV